MAENCLQIYYYYYYYYSKTACAAELLTLLCDHSPSKRHPIEASARQSISGDDLRRGIVWQFREFGGAASVLFIAKEISAEATLSRCPIMSHRRTNKIDGQS